MAVAEKSLAETAPRSPERQRALTSFLGGLYVLASLWLLFAGLPLIWRQLFAGLYQAAREAGQAAFLPDALLLIVTIGLAAGLFFLGRYLEKRAAPPAGFRAGVFAVCVSVFLIGWLTLAFGNLLAEQDLGGFGAMLTLAAPAVLIFAALRLFLNPGFSRWLVSVEEQGWFDAFSYKANQGVRVRRGSMLALLVLGGCGLYVMVAHRTFGAELPGRENIWEVSIPFTAHENEYLAVPLIMFQVHYLLPMVFSLLLIWASWRVVNWPMFADFLIATEAELNKVSWTSRQRLLQDTVVVLVTVVLLVMFLFIVDIVWIKVLSWRYVDVLKVDIREQQLKQQEKSQW